MHGGDKGMPLLARYAELFAVMRANAIFHRLPEAGCSGLGYAGAVGGGGDPGRLADRRLRLLAGSLERSKRTR